MDLQQSQVFFLITRKGTIPCNNSFCATYRRGGNGYGFRLGIFEKISFQHGVFGMGTAVYGAQIVFVQISFPDQPVHLSKGRGIFGRDNNTAGIPVNTIAQSGGKGGFIFGIIFPAAVQVCL